MQSIGAVSHRFPNQNETEREDCKDKDREGSRILYLARIGNTSVVNKPTSVEPVNETLSTSMCSDRAAPAVGPYPGITLSTPGGNQVFSLTGETITGW